MYSWSNDVFVELMGEEDAKTPVLYVGVKSHTDSGVEMLRVNIQEELKRHNSGEKFYRGSECEGRQVQVVSVTDRCRW